LKLSALEYWIIRSSRMMTAVSGVNGPADDDKAAKTTTSGQHG
jgi:hypothetical protein